MSGNLTPYNRPPSPSSDGAGGPPPAYAYPNAYMDQAYAADDEGFNIPWARYLSALKRFKWLMLAIVVIGTAAGLIYTRTRRPTYQTVGTVWISSESPAGRHGGDANPIGGPDLFSEYSWVELIRSFAVIDRVVQRMKLYVTPTVPGDSAVFAGFGVGENLGGGKFELTIDPEGRAYTLGYVDGDVVERGTPGDSIGKRLGFRWAPPASVLGRGRRIEFAVTNPRWAAMAVQGRIDAWLPERSTIMKVAMRGSAPEQTVRTANVLLEEFVNTARDLKQRHVLEIERVLREQLDQAGRSLAVAESAYRDYRTTSITRPSEVGPGQDRRDLGTDPVLSNYFGNKVDYDNVRRDRETLGRMITELRQGSPVANQLFSMPNVVQSSPELSQALNELTATQAKLHAARQYYTDEFKTVKELQATIERLERQTIPQAAQVTYNRLQRRENDLAGRMQDASREIRSIPTRSIDEMRLRRDVQLAEGMFNGLRSNFETAKLAKASAIPDVSVLDPALTATIPTRDRAGLILLMAIAGSFGVAIVAALGLDRLDRRFRYPEQITKDLGMDILGAVPRMHAELSDIANPEEVAQVIEAFRTIRMNLRHAFEQNGPVMLTVSSPGPGDGKSTVSSSLALSFAEAGHRTLLIDGDIRRGALHDIFSVSRRPGLLDYLVGVGQVEDVLRLTAAHANLSLLPSGTRRNRGPELLASDDLPRLIDQLKGRYEVIIVDSPPLAAGIDPFALGVATGNVLLVMRTGATDRHVARAKLQLLRRLPVRLLGVVLNDISAEGVYRNYSYLGGYYAEDEYELGPPTPPSRAGALSERT